MFDFLREGERERERRCVLWTCYGCENKQTDRERKKEREGDEEREREREMKMKMCVVPVTCIESEYSKHGSRGSKRELQSSVRYITMSDS